MAIIGNLPFTILDGQPIVAAPVMADFNFIVSQVNANVPALIPSSTGAVQYVSTVGGAVNAITLTPSPALGAYAAGVSYRFIPVANNTSAVTINVSGLGTRALQYADGTAMTGFELRAGKMADISDNGTNFILMSPPGPSGINVSAALITFGGGSTGIAYNTDTITWIKIGRVLQYIIAIGLNNKGSSVGDMLITGLPYPVNPSWGVGVNQTTGSLYTSAVTYTAGMLAPYVFAGLSSVGIVNSPAAGGAAAFLTNANFANNSQIYVSGSYIV